MAMTIKLNRPINMLHGGSYRDALNENWEMLETWIAENGTEGLHDFFSKYFNGWWRAIGSCNHYEFIR